MGWERLGRVRVCTGPHDPSRVILDDISCRSLLGVLRGKEAVQVKCKREQLSVGLIGIGCRWGKLESRKGDELVWAQGRKRRRNE